MDVDLDDLREIEERAGYCLASFRLLVAAAEDITRRLGNPCKPSDADAADTRIAANVEKLAENRDGASDFGGEAWDIWELSVYRSGEPPIRLEGCEHTTAWEATLKLASSAIGVAQDYRRVGALEDMAAALNGLASGLDTKQLEERIHRERLAAEVWLHESAASAATPAATTHAAVPGSGPTRIPAGQLEAFTASYLANNADRAREGKVTCREIAKASGRQSPAPITKLAAWKTYQRHRRQASPRRATIAGQDFAGVADSAGETNSNRQTAEAKRADAERDAKLDALTREQAADNATNRVEPRI